MDIRTLPKKEKQIYNSIKEQYALTFDKIKIQGNTIRLLKVADIEEYLGGKDPFENVGDFPFWIKLWDSALILSYLLSSLPEDNKQEKSVLELGAGLGAPGLAAASVGFNVTLSDYEDIILDFERVSAAASGLKNVDVKFLDWLKPSELKQFDILAGAEIVYKEEFFEPLLHIFKTCLKPGGAIYLAHDARRQNLPNFLKLAEKDFKIAINKQEIKKVDGKQTILVNCLRPKQ